MDLYQEILTGEGKISIVGLGYVGMPIAVAFARKVGLVGRHCIGVDPYYLTYKAEQLGYHSQIILAGRHINDDMGKYVAENVVKNLIKADVPVQGAIDIVKELREYGIEPIIADETADGEEVRRLYGVTLSDKTVIENMDAVII